MRSSGEEKEVAQFHTAGVAPKVTTTDTEELFGGLNWWPSLNKVASSSDPLSLSMPAHTFQHYWQNLRESEAVSDGWAPTASRLLRVSTVALNFIAAVSGHMEKERERETRLGGPLCARVQGERNGRNTTAAAAPAVQSRSEAASRRAARNHALSSLLKLCCCFCAQLCCCFHRKRERERGLRQNGRQCRLNFCLKRNFPSRN